MSRTHVLPRAALAPFTVLLIGLSSQAFAQTEQVQAPPPVRELVDENGVDLMTGAFGVSHTDIDIGPPESRLSFGRSARAELFGETESFRTSIDVMLRFVPAAQTADGVAYVAVVNGSSSDRFTQSGSTFTSQAGMGSTLVFDSPSQNYIYTTRDGTVIRFPASQGATYDPWDGIRALSIQAPDGTRTEFGNKVWYRSDLWISFGRVQSIVNNAGYQLKLEYTAADSTRITKVAALNRGSAYCDPAADTCAATAGAPAATYAWSEYPSIGAVTMTDAGGRQTRWTMGAGAWGGGGEYWGAGPSAVKSAASATDDLVATGGLDWLWGEVAPSFIVSQVVKRGMTWNYQYVWPYQSGANWPIFRVTNPLGGVREVTWNKAVNQIETDKDELGRTVTYAYDSFGRRTRITYPDGNYVHVTYDGRGNVTESRQVAKPGSGLPDIVVSAVYPSTCSNPKTCNKPTSITNALGGVTDYTYDPTHGGVLTVTGPAPAPGGVRPQTRYVYTPLYAWYRNSGGALVQASTPIYKLTETTSCRTQSSCAGTADEVKTTFSYQVGSSSVASNILLTSITQSSGNGALVATTTMTYDDRGNRVTVDGPLAGSVDTITTRYDILRRVVGVVGPDPDAGGALKRRAERYSYRADNQLTLVERGTVNGLSDPDFAAMAVLEQLSSGFDGLGRKTSEAMVSGGSTIALTQFSYDGFERLECTAVRMNPATFSSPPASACSHASAGIFGPDRLTRRFYNAASQLTKIQTGYDTAGQLDERTLTYTNNFQPYTLTDARGNLTTFQYDGHDRLYRTYFPSPSQAGVSSTSDFEQFAYNNAGGVIQKNLRDGQPIGFGYDGLGRVQTKNLPGSEADVTYGYDNFGHTTSVVTSSQTLTFGYDALGRLRTQTGPHGTFTSDYDAAGRRTQATWPDSFYVTYDYLVTGEMSAVRENGAASGLGVLASFAYDDLGRRVTLTRGNGAVTSYNYNAARLQQITQNLTATAADLTEGFTYNPSGQIATRTLSNDAYVWTGNANVTRSYTPNGLNQYTAIDSSGTSSDARGNLTNFGTGTYSYSSENLLTSGPGSLALSYDPMGRLYQTTTPTGTTRFAYDGDRLVAEYNSANQLLRRYVHGAGADEPLVWYEGSGTTTRRWLHADERGSIIALSDAAGAQIAVNRYDEYGTPAVTNAGRFQYTGQVWLAEAGLYYFKARFYSASLGRFMQTDPIGYASGTNLYAYVGGDPINFRDPLGLAGEDLAEVTVTGTRSPTGLCWGCSFVQLWGVSQEYMDGVLSALVQKDIGPQGPAQCLNANGTVGNDKASSIDKPNVIFGSFDAEGYVMFGIGVHIGGFYDRSTKNFGMFWAFDIGGGLGANAGVSGGVARDLSSFQGAVSVIGAGVGPVSANYATEVGRITKPVAISGGLGVNAMPPLPVPASVHASRSYTHLFATTLPSCGT